MEEIRAEIRHGQDRIREIEEEKQNLSGQIQAAENVLKGCQMKLSSRETMLKQQTEQFNAATVELNSADARIRILTDMQRDYEGYSKAVRTVMREANRGTLRAIHGPVSGLIRTDAEVALAIETALGSAGQNIVVDTQNDARSSRWIPSAAADCRRFRSGIPALSDWLRSSWTMTPNMSRLS